MGRTRLKAKGRKGGEVEHFARLPESVLTHPSLATAPHYVLRALAALVCGYSELQNGSMMLTDSYAKRFGFVSHDTLSKSLRLLEERGLIETTRRVSRRMKIATLYGVTWWEIHYRDGLKLDQPTPASHRYRSFVHPAARGDEPRDPELDSPRPTGDVTPPHGANGANHHPAGGVETTNHRPAPRGHSKNLGGGSISPAPESALCNPVVLQKLVATRSPADVIAGKREQLKLNGTRRVERIRKHASRLGPDADPAVVARAARVKVEEVVALLERPSDDRLN
jgi:DNA-binding transcriptional ArsR family regulator